MSAHEAQGARTSNPNRRSRAASRADSRPTRAGIAARVVGVLLVIVVTSAICALAASLRPTVYTSSATLVYAPPDNSVLTGQATSDSDPQRTLATQAATVRGDTVLGQAAQQLNMSRTELDDDTHVTVDPDGNVLTISVDGGTPSEAARRASTVSDAYVDYSSSQLQSALAAQASALASSIDSLRQQIQDARSDNRGSAALSSALSTLLQKQTSLQAAAGAAAGSVSVLSAARRPESPSSVSAATGAVIGAAIGIVLALGLVLIAGGLRRRPSSQDAPTGAP